MAVIILPSQEYLRQCWDYDPLTGILVWKARPPEHFAKLKGYHIWTAKFCGKVAGHTSKIHGYRVVGLNCSLEKKEHRFIWKLVTGEEPPPFIDHRDLNRSNNRWANLREATKSQNNFNSGMPITNTSGFKGVTKHGPSYRFEVKFEGVRIRKSGFQTKEEAHAAYCEAAQELCGEFWNPG